MPEFISPETKIIEVHRGVNQLASQNNNGTVVIVGLTERGPIDRDVRVTSMNEAQSIYGDFLDGQEVMPWLDFFFENSGGSGEVYIRRITHYTDITDANTSTAVKATKNLDNSGPSYSLSGASPAIVTSATSKSIKVSIAGEVGQEITILDSFTSGASIAAAIQAAVRALTPASSPAHDADYALFTMVFNEDGRYLSFNGVVGATRDVVFSPAIVAAASDMSADLKLGIAGGGVEEAYPISAFQFDSIDEGVHGNLLSVETVRTNLYQTELAADIVSGATQITVVNASGIMVGQYLEITDNTTPSNAVSVVEVKTITNNVITLRSAIVLTETVEGTGATPATVKSLDWTLQVSKGGELKETFSNLSSNPRNVERYFESIINDSPFRSTIGTVTDLAPPSLPSVSRPVSVANQVLTGGLDGDTGITDSDFIGDATARTGMQIVRDIPGANFLVVPGRKTVAVHKALQLLAEDLKLFEVQIDLPSGLTPTAAVAYWQASNLTSDYIATDWPEIKMTDPRDRSKARLIANSAYVLGMRSRLINSRGFGGQQPPAGQLYPVRAAVGLASEEAFKKEVRDILVTARINPIGGEFGRIGYYRWGADTATPGGSGANAVYEQHKRWIILKMKRDIQAIIDRWKLSYVVDENLLANITGQVLGYLRRRRAEGYLIGNTDSDSFRMDFGLGLNSPTTMAAGAIYGKVGVRLGSIFKFAKIEFGEFSPSREQYRA